MTFSLEMSEEDYELIKKYAVRHKMSVSAFIKEAVMERIEDEYDLKCYEEAKAEFEKNPVTYSLEEVAKDLGIDL